MLGSNLNVVGIQFLKDTDESFELIPNFTININGHQPQAIV